MFPSLSSVSLGLGMALGGAELFTGNNLIVMAWVTGNFVGAFMTAVLMFYTTQYTFGAGLVALAALTTANGKTSLAFVPALTLGIMCNALVCLAVWMCYSARATPDRVFTIIPPIAAFVAAGFEHSIANVYFIPMGCSLRPARRTRSGRQSARRRPIFRNRRGEILSLVICSRSRSVT
jgi:formate transporter